MFLVYDQVCFQLKTDETMNDDYLNYSHKQADTCILLHFKNVAAQSEHYATVCNDTGVPIWAVAYSNEVGISIYQRTGTQSRTQCADYLNCSHKAADIYILLDFKNAPA